MSNHVQIRVRAYLRSKHREIVHFKTFDIETSVEDVLKEILTAKKDITIIHMDRDYDKKTTYDI